VDEIKDMLKALVEGQRVTHAKLEGLEKQVAELKENMTSLQQDMDEVKDRLTRVEDGMKYLAGDVYFLKMRSRG